MYSFLNGVMIVITGILLGMYFESLGGLILGLIVYGFSFIGLQHVLEEVFR
jgi:hypothetical protein